jgi:hypothetical protein
VEEKVFRVVQVVVAQDLVQLVVLLHQVVQARQLNLLNQETLVLMDLEVMVELVHQEHKQAVVVVAQVK